ncbi:uncharacterized protein I206_102353 [Kwoniella pini CBS 10737]|uniref:Uncharacterized protein n=1 Tax=Kwoniella pini CBS 10737 TaxID=1296096 RepID=A0A1B9I560_9TREE|nr:uncharacterized protein I206_02700 [Kwoniella pini CBS 10737]OCF50646.1 hypothetical protein I206_02700 [Kwoniella pini CBS 10737]
MTNLESSNNQVYLEKLHYLLSRTSEGSTICPSQIPRLLNKEDSINYPNWRELMDSVRSLIWEQVKIGNVQVTQKGEIRKYEERNEIKGPIRVKKGINWTEDLLIHQD